MNNIEIIKEQIEILRNMQDGTTNNTLQGYRMKIKLVKEITALVLILNALKLDNDYSEVTQRNNKSFEESEQRFKDVRERIEQKFAEYKNPLS